MVIDFHGENVSHKKAQKAQKYFGENNPENYLAAATSSPAKFPFANFVLFCGN